MVSGLRISVHGFTKSASQAHAPALRVSIFEFVASDFVVGELTLGEPLWVN